MKLSSLKLMLLLACCGSQHTLASIKTVSADQAISDVQSYGFVDLEGAKLSAIIIRYNTPIDSKSVNINDYKIEGYTILQERLNGFDKTIESDGDAIKGNESAITKAYVNDKPTPSAKGGTRFGHYVILEVNTNYMLKAQNLVYTTTMMAGVQQVADISGRNIRITAGTKEVVNYTKTQQENAWSHRLEDVITTDKNKIVLPQFAKGSGWSLHRIGDGAFIASHAYSDPRQCCGQPIPLNS